MASPHPPHQPSPSQPSRLFLPQPSPSRNMPTAASSSLNTEGNMTNQDQPQQPTFSFFGRPASAMTPPPSQNNVQNPFLSPSAFATKGSVQQTNAFASGSGTRSIGFGASTPVATGIPFNPSAHNFNAPSPIGFGFGGLRGDCGSSGSSAKMGDLTFGMGQVAHAGPSSGSGNLFSFSSEAQAPATVFAFGKPMVPKDSNTSLRSNIANLPSSPASIVSSSSVMSNSTQLQSSPRTLRPSTSTSSFGGLASLSGLGLGQGQGRIVDGMSTGGSIGVISGAGHRKKIKRRRSDDSMGSGDENTGAEEDGVSGDRGEQDEEPRRVHKKAYLSTDPSRRDSEGNQDDGESMAQFEQIPDQRELSSLKRAGMGQSPSGSRNGRTIKGSYVRRLDSGLLPTAATPNRQHGNMMSPASGRKRDRDEDDEQMGLGRGDAGRGDDVERSFAGKREKLDAKQGDAEEMKDRKDTTSGADIGVLLASLPSQTHLKILLALVQQNPSLLPQLMSLIPTPELSTCLVVLDEKWRAIRDNMPIGARARADGGLPGSDGGNGRSGFGGDGKDTTSTFGFGFGAGSTHSFGFEAGGDQAAPVFGASSSFGSMGTSGGSRTEVSDGYVLNRLMLPLTDFCSSATTYLAYFKAPGPNESTRPEHHPTITFTYIAHLTNILARNVIPLLPASQPCPQNISNLLATVNSAWTEWVVWVSTIVNKQGGMFAASVVQAWYKELSELAESINHSARSGGKVRPDERAIKMTTATAFGFGNLSSGGQTTCAQEGEKFGKNMRDVHKTWVREVGWLIGKSLPGEGGMEMEMM